MQPHHIFDENSSYIFRCVWAGQWYKVCILCVNLSTTTNTVSNPLALGRPSTKSIIKFVQTPSGIGSGCSRPVGVRA